MSGDETDAEPRYDGPKKWRIIAAEWQSEAVITFFAGLDDLYRAHSLIRGGGGSKPRYRVRRPDGNSEATNAPKGLWRNCYNPKWLAKLRPTQVRALNVIDRDYDFSLDARADDSMDDNQHISDMDEDEEL